MATFIGYNTIGQYKDYTLTDFDLIKRDILNAFNIRQGEKVMKAEVGTKIWDLVFEAQTPETATLVREELNRVVAQDPRVFVNRTTVFTQDNGILIEMDIQTTGNNSAETLYLFFNQDTRRASYV